MNTGLSADSKYRVLANSIHAVDLAQLSNLPNQQTVDRKHPYAWNG